MKMIELSADYEVAAKDGTLTVLIGEAQIGSSVVKLNGKKIGEGDITKLILGPGPKINGKVLLIKSVVTDINDNTNRTSITYRLQGGKTDQQFISSGTVDEDGDSIIYRAKFRLIGTA